MNNKKKRSTAKKLLAGLIALTLLILPIYATNSDNQQETLDIGASDEISAVDKTTENAEADHQADGVVGLGASSIGEIEIIAPNRKIPFGQADFDLAYGVVATNKEGVDVSASLSVVDDGGFDGNTAGDYIIKYSIDIDGKTAEASRTITVTTYDVMADDVYFRGDTMPLKPEEIDAGEEVANHSLISGLSVIGEDGNEYASYAVAVSSKSLNLESSGTYTIDFNVVYNEEILVQFTRDFYVSTMSTFSSTIGMPLFQVGEKFPLDHPTYPEEYKHIYYAVNADGRIYIGNREMGREGKAERQWFSGYSNSSALRITRGGVETIYKLGGYIGTTASTSTLVEKVDEQTIKVTYELPDTAAMTAVITYHLAPDSRTVGYTWKIINNGAAADVKLYYGGDTYFAGSDKGQSFYNSRTKAVYVKTSISPTLYGMMILRASELTPLDYFFGGYYALGIQYVNYMSSTSPNLPGSHINPVINFDNTSFPGAVSTSGDIDQGLYIQWDENLASGASMTKEAVVQITESGNLQVIAPEGKSAPSGVKLPYTFLLENVATVAETATFTVTSSKGWAIEVAGGSNSVTVASGQVIPVTVYLTVPAGQANGTKDTLTLSVTSNRVTSGSTITTIDNNLPAIQDIRIVSQSNTALQAAVDFTNVTGTRSTKVTIFNEDGTATSIPPQTKTIASGGTFDFNISGLAFNKNYIIRAEVVGIDYYSEKVFTITTIATGMTLKRGAATAPANVNINGTASLMDSTVSATILPADVTNKTVNWTATPAGNATVTATTQSGANTTITLVKNGVTTITAKAAVASNPSKSLTYTVDTQNPAVGTTTVTGSGSVGNPFVLTTSATDPQKDGYASGLKNIYYKTQLSTAAAPSFDPAAPTGWTLYSTTPTNFQDASGTTLAVYIAAVDNFSNYTIYKHTSTIISDVIPPVITVSDIHVLQNSVAPTFPVNANATDNIDGTITLVASHVDKTTVPTTTTGRQTVKYTVTDRSGNTATKDQFVYIHGLPVISTKVDILELHVNDISTDFAALTDARIGVSAKVSTVDATGFVDNDVNVTGITVTSNNIIFGTVGIYSVAYTATYPHTNGGPAATSTKTVTVKVSANPTTTPTTPVITASAGTLRSFKDYTAYQITDTTIKSNASATGSAVVPTYTILKSGGGTATIGEVNGSIASYTVRYRAENADGTTAYKDVPLYVYGKLTYTAPTNEQVLTSITPLAAKTLSATFQGNEGGITQTFTTAVVISPANANISAVGRTPMAYSVKYPASFDIPVEETPSYYIFAQGLPVISTKVDILELHVNDISTDFAALTDARIGVSAKVSTVDATGFVDNDVNVTGITVTSNNINFGTVGIYSVTYTATYPHANVGSDATSTKTVTVKVSANPTTTPTTPVITASAGTLRSFKDYAAYRITDATIKSNASATGSAVVPTYTILKSGGGTATIGEVNGSIASYTVRYRAENADGTTAYKDVPLYVYGKLTYTAPTNEQVLTSVTPLAAKTLSATFQGNEGGITQTFTTTVVINPANANISAVGRTTMAYSVKYPASFDIPVEETPSYYIFAQGIPEISASNSVTLVLAETSADFNNKTDPRLALSANVKVVGEAGTIAIKTIALSAINFAGTITYGTEGIYPVKYTTSYEHPALIGAAAVTGNGEKNVNIIVTAFNPDGPGIEIKPTSPSVNDGKFWHFIGAGQDLTDAEIKSALTVNLKPPATSSTSTYTIISGSNTVPLATALGTPGTYSVVYRVTDDQNRTNTAYFDLYVVGAITVKNPTDVHTGTSTTPLETNQYHPGATNAASGTFVSYDGTTKAAAVAVTPTAVARTSTSKVALTYKLTYPTNFPAPTTHNLSRNSTVYVHGYPVITANDLTLSLFDTSLDVRNNAAIGLDARATSAENTPVMINKTDIQISYPEGPIRFGTAGTYKVRLVASYQPHASMAALSTEKIITVTISATGNPEAPSFSLSATGSDPIRYFQGFTHATNTVDDTKVRGNVSVSAQAGATSYTLSYVVLKADGTEITLANAKAQIGEYTIRYKAEDNLNRTSYFTVKLHTIGTITLGTTTPIETIQGGAGAKLPKADYTGAKGVSATFIDSDGTTKNAAVTIDEITISSIEAKNVVYTAKYPISYENTNLEKTHTRIVRVHGIPVITASSRIDLRTGATTAELLNGITAKVSLAPIAVGGAVVVQTVPVTVSTPQNVTAIGKFQLPLTATYTLPATYNTPLILTTTAKNRLVVLHGHITYTGSDITLSTNFLAADFETVGRPKMNVVAKVSYYDTTTSTVVTDTLTPIVPPSTSINFGTAGTNNQVYSAGDSTAANKPAGLSGVSLNKTFVVTIQADIVGNAPVITVTNNPIKWLSTAAVNKAELMSGVTANDTEDKLLTSKITIVVKPSGGSAVTITPADTTLSPGLHTAVYTVLDSDGNKVVKEVPLYVYSPMTVTGGLIDTNVRENIAQFKPDISSWKLSYTDGITGTTKVINSVSNGAIVGTTAATYSIATRGNFTYNVTANHPILDDPFISFTGAITIPTTVSGSGALKVHTNIILTGHESYDAVKAGGRATTSYFKVGQDVGDSALLNGVTATYTNSDGNLVTLTSRITVEASSRNNSKANNFTVKYAVADDIIAANPKTTGGITVAVDSLPVIKAVTNPVYINAGGDEAEALAIAGPTAIIYYGMKPDVPVTLPITATYSYQVGINLAAAGNKATLTATAVHPDNPSNTSKLDIPVKAYVKPSISLNGTGYLEMFKGEYTTDQIVDKAFDVKAKFTDENGVEKQLEATIDVDAKTFADSKRYDIPAYVIDPYTDERIETQPATIFVLNKAYIVARDQYQIKNTKEGYGSAEVIEILNSMIHGIGEEVVGGQIVSRAFAVTSSTNQIKVSRFGVTYDLSRVVMSAHGKDQRIKILGTFHYRNQELSVESALYLIKYNSSEGSNKPDTKVPPGIGGAGTGGTGIDGNGDYGLTGEFGLSNGAITFWKESRNLIDRVGGKDETWIIKHSDPKNPTKNSGTRSKVIAVPGEYLEMPSYVINTLREQSAHRLQLNLGDYIWYLDSGAAWINSDRTNYPIGVKATNNGKITKLLGKDIESQQLTFGFLDGWNTMAHLGVKITNANLQGEQLYMYYYNSYTGELEFVGDMEDIGSNWHSVAVKGHYGEYVITDQLLLNVRAVNMTVADNPSTGGYNYIVKYTHDMFDAGAIVAPTSEQVNINAEHHEADSVNMWIYVAITAVGLAVVVVYALKKRKEQDI